MTDNGTTLSPAKVLGRSHNMRRTVVAAAVAALVAPLLAATPARAADPAAVADPTAFVNPLIGTANRGDVFPGAVLPFGMAAFSPEHSPGNQARTAAPGGYRYEPTQ